ncbi:dihydroneopterin aldolase [Candidatus Dactylopiibacterium carminicum]|uniref:dihydroneopterin aldolase n=1 Tax=Candidatus Dactylopiibacterium carminicum TaxID=857335 RepID=UPI001482FEBA|nr:dihydroneopterin aldolase [Candidatus Dactylopiibacterium carminicum]
MEFLNRRIHIREFSLPVSIGFYEAEKLRPQRVLIDVDLLLAPLRGAMPDDVRATVNYDLIHQAIPPLVAGRHFDLQETLCHEILSLCAGLKGVTGARVWVRKPDIYADCESAGYSAEIVVPDAV